MNISGIIHVWLWWCGSQLASGSQIVEVKFKRNGAGEAINVITTTRSRSRIKCSADCSSTTGCTSFTFNETACYLLTGDGGEFDMVKSSTTIETSTTTTESSTSASSTRVSTITTTPPQTTTPGLTACDTIIPDNSSQDCKTLLDSGYTASGMYTIKMDGRQLDVFCDQTTEGGGWTVVQQRNTGSVSFYRSWSDYATGFGDKTCSGNYWLGLDWINKLIINKQSELYIKFTTPLGNKFFARYSTFSVGDASTYFILNVGGYSGTAGDSLTYHNGMKFTTLDSDNDMGGSNCAIIQEGGWWYNNCLLSHLNGRYLNITNGDWGSNLGMIWFNDLSLASMMETTMLVREA